MGLPIKIFFFLFLVSLFIGYGSCNQVPVLIVGEELKSQILPLKMGEAIYKLEGLKESRWYEVKISYPSSVPASFSLHVKNNAEDFWLNKNRRLLDTEKLIFKSSGQSEMYILVSVAAAGIVAKPNVEESKIALFNIVCDELSFGIPHKAWWVGSAAILCLIFASIIPHFIPLQRLLIIQNSRPSYCGERKNYMKKA